MIFRTGVTYKYNSFQISWQYSYTDSQYTDATNAEFTSNAVNGIVPAYTVMDLSAKYSHKFWRIETGINNLLDNVYFTRRASGYPGPGIIPAEPRSFYITLGVVI